MKTRLLLVVLALGVTLTAQTPDPSTLPLLQSGALQHLGAFRLPTDTVNGSNFTNGGESMAFNPATNSLYITGYNGTVAEVSIPTPVKSGVIGDLPYATFRQPFAEPSEGHIRTDIPANAGLTGLMVYGDRLYGTATIWYDANGTQRVSHFSRSLKLDQPSFSGWSAVWQDIHSAFVSGFMALVPSEWQAKLGGPAVTGQCCVSIVSRTSNGPAAFSFDPAKVGQVSVVPASPLVYYTIEPGKDTLGPWEGSNPTYGATTYIRGMAIIAGTRTALYFGNNGMGPYCYGVGTSEQVLAGTTSADGSHYCYDPTLAGKGQHAYPYRYQVWAYDLNDLAAVKAGTKQPWEVKPYGVWPLDLPTPSAKIALGGLGYDAARQIIYVAQLSADNNNHVIAEAPIVHAFKVTVSTTTPTSTTDPVPLPPATTSETDALKATIAALQSRLADIKKTLQAALPMPSNTKTTVKDAVNKALALTTLPPPPLPPPPPPPPIVGCTGLSPIWKASADYASVNTCVTQAAPGDTITVTGNATWLSTLMMTRGVRLVGSGNPVITGKRTLVYWTPNSSAQTAHDTLVITGFTFDADNATFAELGYSGILRVATSAAGYVTVVVTNSTIKNGPSSGRGLYLQGWIYGVAGGNTFDRISIPSGMYGNDYDSWALRKQAYGVADTFYFEDNLIKFSSAYSDTAGWMESGQGGAEVVRYNTWDYLNATNPGEFWDAHGLQSPPGGVGTTGCQNYSTMVTEFYGNKIINQQNAYRWMAQRGGWMLMFFNLLTGNSNPGNGATQYYCNACATAGNFNQKVENTYVFRNLTNGSERPLQVYDPGAGYGCAADPIVENDDFFNYVPTFDGSTGVGCGTLAARPASASEGRGYFATNQSCSDISSQVGVSPATPISGTLYKYTAGVWTPIFTPYPYPDPRRR